MSKVQEKITGVFDSTKLSSTGISPLPNVCRCFTRIIDKIKMRTVKHRCAHHDEV